MNVFQVRLLHFLHEIAESFHLRRYFDTLWGVSLHELCEVSLKLGWHVFLGGFLFGWGLSFFEWGFGLFEWSLFAEWRVAFEGLLFFKFLFSEASFDDFFVVSLQDLVVDGDGEFVVFEVNLIFDSVHEMGDLMLNFCKIFFVKLSFGVSVWKDGQQFGREENGCKIFFHKDNLIHLDGPKHIPKRRLIQHTFILILNALHVPQLNLLFETSEGFD